MKLSRLKWLKFSLVLLLFLSCNKDQRKFEKKLKPLKYGKYTIEIEMHHVNNGNNQLFSYLGYGPFINNAQFTFYLTKIEQSNITVITIRDYNNKISLDLNGIYSPIPSYFDANYYVHSNYMTADFNSGDTLTGKITFTRIP